MRIYESSTHNVTQLQLCLVPICHLTRRKVDIAPQKPLTEQRGKYLRVHNVLPAIGTELYLRRNRRMASRAFDNRRSGRATIYLRPTMRAKTISRSNFLFARPAMGCVGGLFVCFVRHVPPRSIAGRTIHAKGSICRRSNSIIGRDALTFINIMMRA